VRRSLRSLVLAGAFLAGCGSQAATAPNPTPLTIHVTPAPTATLAPTPTAVPVSTPKPTPKLKPTPTPTPVPVPPKPSGVRFDRRYRVSADQSTVEITQTVTWRAPRTEGVEIWVYGVTECIGEPASPKLDTAGPCLVVHTPLPASVLRPLATAPAADGTASWTWTQETGCNPGLDSAPDGPPYYAVVLAAYSASGHSIFAIAEPGSWFRPGPNTVVC